ncbi:STAS/SEC14 domain-containing protein [Myxococcus sp. AB025B]|uniref:STAS/SEC14 domain-containing protein n=1 Tax=Myxococcus TaxID=32 RepID=UPI0011417C57|nr:STAS/SEC14 domain-containing protein [Myxococcus sp. AB025B]
MFRIDVDNAHAIVGFVLEGYIRVPEMEAFVTELERATDSLAGQDIKILADLRAFRPASPEAANMIRRVQEYGLRSGVVRVAELVESEIVALQLNRVAQNSRTDRILRRFWEEAPARLWLIQGDAAEPPQPRP